MGIKGVNVSMALEDFDLTIGIVVDYMHCILLGVTKTMMELWFLPKNNKKDCFLAKYRKERKENQTGKPEEN